MINARGEVIGINAAISSRASSIGFAVPINQATTILPQLKLRGRVVRGYIGVTLKEVDPDVQRSLGLPSATGALVQDVAPSSPAERAGVRAYDLILGVDGREVRTNDGLIREIAARAPGSTARLRLLRDNREMAVRIKLAERPGRAGPEEDPGEDKPESSDQERAPAPLGASVRELDREVLRRLEIPERIAGVLVARVEPMSPAFDASIERGHVIMEINRQRVSSVADYQRITNAARPGDVLAFYVYAPGADQRALRTVRVEASDR